MRKYRLSLGGLFVFTGVMVLSYVLGTPASPIEVGSAIAILMSPFMTGNAFEHKYKNNK